MGALHHLLYNLSFNKNDFELFVLEHCNVAYLMANVLHDAGLSWYLNLKRWVSRQMMMQMMTVEKKPKTMKVGMIYSPLLLYTYMMYES